MFSDGEADNNPEMDQKPSASTIVKPIPEQCFPTENNGTFANVFEARHEEVFMCFKEIASRIRNVTDGFNQIDTLLDKHYKMSFHMEVMLDKLAKKVDRIYEILLAKMLRRVEVAWLVRKQRS